MNTFIENVITLCFADSIGSNPYWRRDPDNSIRNAKYDDLLKAAENGDEDVITDIVTEIERDGFKNGFRLAMLLMSKHSETIKDA